MVRKSPFPDIAIPDAPIDKYVLEEIQKYGDDVALVDHTRGKSLTFRQLGDDVRSCSAALHSRGLRKGEIVAICSSNRVEYPVVLLASAACGAIATPCNPLYQEVELRQQFKISKPSVIFCDPEAFGRVEKVADDIPSLRQVYTFGENCDSISYETLVNSGKGRSFQRPNICTRQDVCLLPYSSGTTGLPKGVMLSHYAVQAQVAASIAHMIMTRSCCYYMVVPMFHTFGFTMVFDCLIQGVKNVFDSRFDAERLFQAVQTHKVSHFSAVPPIMILLAQTQLNERYDTSSLLAMMCGAAPIAPQLVTNISIKYKLEVLPSYGMTEMVPLAIALPIVKKPKSVGMIACCTTIKVIDVDTGKELGPDEDGEILAKGPQMMSGYFNNPEATARTIDADGWLHTGDIGHYDKDGLLYVVDRLKELIKYKGFQVPPAELEATLLNHQEIDDVAVIGIPDPLAGEVPKAFVVKKKQSLTEEEVKQYIEGELTHYKHLRGGVQFLESIPKSASGKILRRELRKLPVENKSCL